MTAVSRSDHASLAIEIQGLRKSFGPVRALDGLELTVREGDITGKLSTVLGTAAVQLPAVWLLAAVTVALFGVVPRFTPVAWGVLVGFIAVYLFGSLSGAPQWVLDLEPFAHIPRVGAGDFSAGPLLWLLAIDTALIVLGLAAFRRHDVCYGRVGNWKVDDV